MDAFGWVVLAGIVGYPLLVAYAYREFRRGNRSRQSLYRGGGLGGVGFAALLLRAADRWLATPADDVVAVATLVVFVGSAYALYRGYSGGDSDADATAQN